MGIFDFLFGSILSLLLSKQGRFIFERGVNTMKQKAAMQSIRFLTVIIAVLSFVVGMIIGRNE